MSRRKVRKIGTSKIDFQKTQSFKDIECSTCKRIVRVDPQTESVLCWQCSAKKVPPPEIKEPGKKVEGPKRPKGWQRMKVFVDSEGKVFHKGTEQPKLKGTLPATPIKPKKSMVEKEKAEAAKDRKLIEFYEEKKRIKENEQKQTGVVSSNIQGEGI